MFPANCYLGTSILMERYGFTPTEWRQLQRLKTPALIQRFLDRDIAYNQEPEGDTCYSPRRVLRDRVAHCMEGALFAAAALRVQGFPPLLLDLAATQDSDHVLAIFRQRGHWGAIAKSNFAGLRFREPVYRTVRELALSYFEHYYNLRGQKTLRAYSRPVGLRRFDPIHWMTAADDVWEIPSYLCDIRHTPLLTAAMERNLNTMDRRLFAAGRVGSV
ncbi:MAG: hypothetical protein M3O35_22475 [Acidobacteriota bacterium]|nr:hypothetical protein [Acidobacteriota bacterium]